MPQPKTRFQPTLPDVRTIWRWHFYAGLFCVPFVLWLSLTGIVYLFRPQIEGWLDRPYEGLLKSGETGVPPEALVKAALNIIPGSALSYYELPRTPGAAPQIVVGQGANEYRVYVHPGTGQVLDHVDQRDRLFAKVFLLHGELMAGEKGSMLIELAGCWTIVLVLTGLALWWPRGRFRAAGYLFPRLQLTGRLWWKDVHAVTGVWVSFLVIALLLTGLPWAKSWGATSALCVHPWPASPPFPTGPWEASRKRRRPRLATPRARRPSRVICAPPRTNIMLRRPKKLPPALAPGCRSLLPLLTRIGRSIRCSRLLSGCLSPILSRSSHPSGRADPGSHVRTRRIVLCRTAIPWTPRPVPSCDMRLSLTGRSSTER